LHKIHDEQPQKSKRRRCDEDHHIQLSQPCMRLSGARGAGAIESFAVWDH
jgi:hypothetical protein